MRFSSRSGSRSRNALVEINLTSLVDIIFNLLLFFMLTSSISQNGAFKVNLPEAETADVGKEEGHLSLLVLKDGSVKLDNESISWESLGAKFEELNKNDDLTVILNADEDAQHKAVIKVMDLARKKGVKQISIGTIAKKSVS
jgi:biopolymer transport protein ExbD